MATHSSVLAWRIPWTEKPGSLQSMGLHRVGHYWSNLAATATYLTLWEMLPYPPGSLLLWCHCITLSHLVVMVHQQLGRGWLTLQSLGGWKSCYFNLNCKLMGHHGKSKCRHEELKEKIQLCSIFRSFSLDQFCIISFFFLDSGFDKTNYPRASQSFFTIPI